MKVKVGEWNPNGNQIQTQTGFGFRPQAALFFCQYLTGNDFFVSENQISIGMTDGVGQGFANMGDPGTWSVLSNASTLRVVPSPWANGVTFVSMDADGFTISSTLLSTAVRYVALGEIVATKFGTFGMTNTATQAVTGVGFQPDLVFFLPTLFTSVLSTMRSSSTDLYMCFGMSTATTQGFSCYREIESIPTTVGQWQRSSHCMGSFNPSTGAITFLGKINSMDSDGFTIGWTNQPASAYQVMYLAVKGGQYKVGTDTQRTSAGTKATTGVGFRPLGVFFSSCDAVANTAVDQTKGNLSFGVTDGTSHSGGWNSDADAATPSYIAKQTQSATYVLNAAQAVASPTIIARAAVSTLDTDGFTLDWSTADATAREFLYLAIGDVGARTPRHPFMNHANPAIV